MALSIHPIAEEAGVRPGRLFIGGAWQDADAVLDVVHPSTAEVTTQVARGGAREIDAAVRAARRAFDEGPWPRLAPNARRRLLLDVAARVRADGDALNTLQSIDNGMPIAFSSMSQVSYEILAELFEYYAGWVDKLAGDTLPSDAAETFVFTLREPVGVVGAIIPWNAPLILLGLKLAPALAMGNTVVLKPSELAPLSSLRLMEILAEADLPEGVVNLVTGTGEEAGDALVRHPGVDKISFTGGAATGKAVLAAAADSLKRVSLELGGKSANIVFADAPNPALAAMNAVGNVSMGLSGQGCACTTRALVEESIYDEFLETAQKFLDGMRPGFPFDPATTSGPLVSRRQLERVLGYVDSGREDGARLVRGGRRLTAFEGDAAPLAEGFFVEPTLFADVRNDMRIAREEIFGPVLCVMPFRDTRDALRIANDSDYGLAGQVWTSNLNRALEVTRGVRTGTIGVNGYNMLPAAPFGGVKQSGFGREGGRESLDLFSEVKTVFVDLRPGASPGGEG